MSNDRRRVILPCDDSGWQPQLVTYDTATEFEKLIEGIYDAGMNPDLWPAMIEAIRCQTGGALAAMFYRDEALQGRTFSLLGTSGYPAASLAAYEHHFAAKDVRSPTIARLTAREIYLDDRQLAFAEVSRSAIFNDLFRPIDGGRAIGANLFSDAGRFCVLSVHRSLQGGVFRRTQVDRFERIVPHVIRALQVYRQVLRSDSIIQGLSVALDRMSIAVLLVDRHSVILRLNAAAEVLLRAPGTPLRVDQLRLTGTRTRTAADLQADIAQAIASRSGEICPPPPIRSLPGLAEGAGPFGLMVVPVRGGDVGGVFGAPLALVFVSEPAFADPLDAEALVRQFGLSHAEAHIVAGISVGDAVDVIAERRAVSRETVRVQLRHIFAKMGVRSQGRLIALASRSLAALRRPNPR